MTPSLVSYPDSDDDIEEQEPTPKPRPALPPLPATFHDLYTANARTSTSDNPALHGGRKRALPHVHGMWPSHVYLEWLPSQAESSQLYSLVNSVKDAVERANKERRKPLPVPDLIPSLHSVLGVPLPLHISLSRTLQLRTDDRDAFLEALGCSLRKAKPSPFRIRFGRLKWVPNFDRTRWFLVLGVEKPPTDQLNNLLSACNAAAQKCGQPGLYTGGFGDGPKEQHEDSGRPRKRRTIDSPTPDTLGHAREPGHLLPDLTEYFHISIAWNLTEPHPSFIDLVRNVDVSSVVDPPRDPFDTVKARIGNKVHSIPLSNPRAQTDSTE